MASPNNRGTVNKSDPSANGCGNISSSSADIQAFARAGIRMRVFATMLRGLNERHMAAMKLATTPLVNSQWAHQSAINKIGTALSESRFERLEELSADEPELQTAIEELHVAKEQCSKATENRQREAEEMSARIHIPTLNDHILEIPSLECSFRDSPSTVNEQTLSEISDRLDQLTRQPKIKRKSRMPRDEAELLIAAHLARRPHDTAEDVRCQVGCAKGVVTESSHWKANQLRRKAAKKQGKDPIALPLEDYLSCAGDRPSSQLRDHRESVAAIDDRIDQEDDAKINQRINEVLEKNPKANPVEVALQIDGCTARHVEVRQSQLDQLCNEQAESSKEDAEESDQRPVRKRL